MCARILLLPLLLVLLAACGGGSSGANGPDPFGTGNESVPALSVAILDSVCNSVSEASFSSNADICVQATLTIDNSIAAGEVVSFTLGSGIGELSASTALTDSNGVAEVFISNTALETGADSITATYSIASATASYEYTAAETILSLTVRDASCNTVTSPSFTTNQNICVQALLSTDGAPVSSEVVSFTLAGSPGSLSTSSALTNSLGIAQVIISNEDANAGASSVSASFSSLTESANYEYLALPPEVSLIPEIQISMYQNGNQISRFRAEEQVQIQALVLDADDAPVADAIVTFSLQGSGPVLSPTTALTNSSGIAQVGMTADDNSLGAFAVQASVTLDSFEFTDSLNFEVQASDTVIDESATRFGHIDSEGNFVEGIIGSSAEVDGEVVISAGATVGFTVALVDEQDNRLQTPTPVSFTSNCVSNGQATIDATVTTINGVASATFEDINCAGSSGNSDQIIASVVINNTTLTITRELTIQPENIGSVSFVSATPDEIVLSGTGGQNSASVSTLVFQVNGELGNPLAQQQVNFALNTTTGGLTLSPSSGLTNSSGQVSTRVTAGSVPTAVRVTATATGSDGSVIRTQSDLLSVNTGLPDQNSFSMSSTLLNPEAFSIDGQTATITVRLADSFNNPVPNGTTVNFTTEGGTIESTCSTGEDEAGDIDQDAENTGTCSVTWTSSNPRPNDHRITILATAIGHETLFDSNGNNAYDDADGGPILDTSDAGFSVSQYGETGFVDMSEAWRDDDEDENKDPSEIFIDYNNNGSFDAADGLFSGPQCTAGSMCGEDESATLHVRKSLVMIMSGSNALWRLYFAAPNDPDYFNDANVAVTNDPNVTASGDLNIPDDETRQITLVYYDEAEQLLPAGTAVGVVNTDNSIGTTIDTVANSNRRENSAVPGSLVVIGNLTNQTGAESSSSSFSFVIDSPAGIRTNVNYTVVFE
ncbi:MAG: Ig-like domain-containing protein [Aestuariibacter sp.]